MKVSPLLMAANSIPPGVVRMTPSNREAWSKLRENDVTASDIAALFGQHEYKSRNKLWKIKTGAAAPDEENWFMELGAATEPLAINKFAELHPDWTIIGLGNEFYYRDPAARVGCTPDAIAIRPDRPGFGIIQIKTASGFGEKKWTDASGESYCPTWIALQAMTETVLTGASWGVVGALMISNGKIVEVETPVIPEVFESMKTSVAEFWKSVDANEEPPFDPAKDSKAILSMFADDNAQTIDLSANNRLPELLDQREILKEIEARASQAEKDRKAIDVEIIMLMGNAAAAVIADGRIISAKTTRRKGYTVNDTSYRTVRISGTASGAARAPKAAPQGATPGGF